MDEKSGTLYGVGVGPGDPELMTLQSCRTLELCPVIAAPRTENGNSLALDIACKALDLSHKEILMLDFVMTRDSERCEEAYQKAANLLVQSLSLGKDVAMVVLGDVSVYATFSYVQLKVEKMGFKTVMIPGITSFSAVAARLNLSLTETDLPLHIIPAAGMDLDQALDFPGTKVLMKSGSHIDETLRILEKQNLLENSAMVVNCGLSGETVCTDLTKTPSNVGYFTTIVVKE